MILRNAVRIGFPLRGVESQTSDLRDERIEVIDEERVHGVTGVFQLLHNVHVPMPIFKLLARPVL